MHTPNSDLRAALGHGLRECATRSRGVCSGIAGKMATEDIDRAKVPRENFLARVRRYPRLLARRTRSRDPVELVHVSPPSSSTYRSVEMYDELPPGGRLKSLSVSQKNQYISTCRPQMVPIFSSLCLFAGASLTFFHTCTNTVGHLNSHSYIYICHVIKGVGSQAS